MFFDCRFKGQRQICVDLSYVIQIEWIPGSWNGNIQFLSPTIGVPFVPNPLRCGPSRSGYAEPLREQRPIAGECSYRLVARRVEHPALKIQSTAYFHHCIHGLAFIAQVRDFHRIGGVARETGNGTLIIQNADGNATPSEATCYSQPLVIAAYHQRPRWIT